MTRSNTKRTAILRRLSKIMLLGLALFVVSGTAQAFSPEADRQQIRPYGPGLESVLKPIRHAQSEPQGKRKNLRSRSEVVREVKRRYNAEVLKISLNKNSGMYRVRILMPNGKVRNLQVRAYN